MSIGVSPHQMQGSRRYRPSAWHLLQLLKYRPTWTSFDFDVNDPVPLERTPNGHSNRDVPAQQERIHYRHCDFVRIGVHIHVAERRAGIGVRCDI